MPSRPYEQPPAFLGKYSLETSRVENPALAEEMAYQVKRVIEANAVDERLIFESGNYQTSPDPTFTQSRTYAEAVKDKDTMTEIRVAQKNVEAAYYERHGTTKRNVRIFSQNSLMVSYLADCVDEHGQPLESARKAEIAAQLGAVNQDSKPINILKLKKLYAESLLSQAIDYRVEADELLFRASDDSEQRSEIKLSQTILNAVFNQPTRSLNYINEREQEVLAGRLGFMKVYERGSWAIDVDELDFDTGLLAPRRIAFGAGKHRYVSAERKRIDILEEELCLTRLRIQELEKIAIPKFVMAAFALNGGKPKRESFKRRRIRSFPWYTSSI